jgi:hypothetical protein
MSVELHRETAQRYPHSELLPGDEVEMKGLKEMVGFVAGPSYLYLLAMSTLISVAQEAFLHLL